MIIVALVITGLFVGRDILIPLTLAAFLSILLMPGVRWLVDVGVPRAAASLAAVLTVVLLLVGSALFLAHQVASFADELPKYELTIRGKVRSLAEMMRGSGSWRHTSELLKRVSEDVAGAPRNEDAPTPEQRPQPTPIASFVASVRSAIPTFATLGLSLLFTIFMLFQYQEIRDRIVRIMGSHEIGRSSQALNAAASDLSHFFLLQVSLNASFGVVIGVAMWLIGIPNPAVWGLLAALMRFVPYAGSLIAALLPAIVAAAIDPGWWKFFATAGTFIIADLVVGQFVEPLLFGRATRLSPFAVLFAIVFWTSVWGPLGLILAVPLTLALVVFGEHMPQLSPLALVLGNAPALKPHERLYHLLSAGDVSQAIREAEQQLDDTTSVQRYLDEVALPAFKLGSDDFSRGVLETVHLDRLETDLTEFTNLLKELIELKYEEHASAFERPDTSDAANHRLYFVPGRGPFDRAATHLIAAVTAQEIAITYSVSSLGGLTSLGDIVAKAERERPDAIVLVSVGGLTRSQLALLVRRSQRDMPKILLLMGWLAGSPDGTIAGLDEGRSATSAAQLISMARAVVEGEGRRNQPSAAPRTSGRVVAPGEQTPKQSDTGARPERQVLVVD
jgi:predicted PurR-regulated permease PerM